jgi:hypothetical protein
MTTDSMTRPTAMQTPPLVRTLAALFLVTLAIGIATTFVIAAVRPSLFV